MMELALNELSSYINVSSGSEAKNLYDTFFIDTCLNVQKEFNVKLILQHSLSPKSFNFHTDYSFEKWISELEKDQKSRVLSMLTTDPFIRNYPYYKIGTTEGNGIGYAYENDCILVSFSSHEKWTNTTLNITCESLTEDGDIQYEELTVSNCFNEESAKHHYQYLREQEKNKREVKQKSITSGNQLWGEKDSLFPNLIFCESTEAYILTLSGKPLSKLLNRLIEFEKYFRDWVTGNFDRTAIGGTPRLESETREIKYKNELTIMCPDTNNRFFTWHCDVLDGRMHFFPDMASRKCYIGYIGRKIGT